MKKLYVLALAVCMMAGSVNAQKAYLRLGVGGGIGLKQYLDGYWADETHTASSDNYEIKSMGLGGGFNVNLAFGYMISDNVGLELGLNEFIGLNKKVHRSYSSDYYDQTVDQKLSGMMLQVVPALVITPGLEKINPYARLGMILGVFQSVNLTYDATTTGQEFNLKDTDTEHEKLKDYGGIACGFTAAAGASLNLSEKLDFYAELVFNGISYAPSKGKYKEWTENGVDKLATATTKEKEWTYEKKFDANEDIPDGSPDKQPKMSYYFSNVELNIGIKLKL